MSNDRIIDMLFDHEARLKRIEENMVTKQEMGRVYDTLDKILGFVTKHGSCDFFFEKIRLPR